MQLNQEIKKEDLKINSEKTNWGIIYYYYGKNFRFALYIYDDDKNTIYLSNLDVYKNSQKQGIGTAILKFVIKEALNFKAKVILLKCLKTSYVYNWYLKNGYEYYCQDKDDRRYVWLKQIIDKEK